MAQGRKHKEPKMTQKWKVDKPKVAPRGLKHVSAIRRRWLQDGSSMTALRTQDEPKMTQKYRHIACSGEDINESKKHLANSEDNIKMTPKLILHAARMARSRLKNTSCMLLMGWQQDDSNAQFACCGNDTKMTQKDILQTSRMTSRGVTITSRMLLGWRQDGSEAHLACH